MPDRPPIWLVSKEHVGARRMGPVVRLLDQIGVALDAGYQPVVVCPSWEGARPAETEIVHSPGILLDRWRPGQPVVVDPYIQGRWLFALLGSPLPFDLDFYCVSLPETAESFPGADRGWVRRERIRRALKYAWAARAARYLYFSTPGQIQSFLGMLATGPDGRAPELVGRLAERCIEIPMGVRPRPPAGRAENPYPQALHGRPVALWGGGIWSWFDLGTLVEAFARLPDPDAGPALFFLASTNGRPDPRSDAPIHAVRERAQELGLLGRSIHFNERAVAPGDLSPWLEHATLGVMSNPRSWESMVSWRTRYLDLLAMGRPLVASGSDPLGDRMAEAGAALVSPAGDPAALAANITRVCTDPLLARSMGAAAHGLAQTLSVANIGARWIESLRAAPWEPRPPAAPSPWDLLRFRMGR